MNFCYFSDKTHLAGHCTYHHVSGYTPEITRKMTARQRESLMRRKSGNNSQDRLFHKCSRKRGSGGLKNVDSPPLLLSNKKFSTYKKLSSQSLELQSSSEAISLRSLPAKQQDRSKIVDSGNHQPGEIPGKYMNLNRVLMERLITNQRNGTRSADGTPVTLRKQSSPSIYNGKYIKNNYVTNLISSDANFNDRRNSTEESLDYPDLNDKPRSHSISGHCSHIVNTPRTPRSVGIGLNDLDKEGDMKYRKLIEEAENIIEDLQVKTKSDYLSPTFRCKNGMERAKPSSPLVFSVPPSPLSLRYNVCRDGYETPPRELCSNNNSLYEQSTYPTQKEKNFENEDGLLKTISKTLEKIIIRGTSDTNRKLDKSVSDPFAKGKRTFVLPSTEMIYSNINPNGCDQQNRSHTGFATPNLIRRSSTGNSSSKIIPVSGATKLNQNDLSRQSSFRKIFRRPDKSKTTSIDAHLDKHNYPENGFCLNSSPTNIPKEHIYENILNQDTNGSNQELSNAKFIDKRGPLIDYSPNGNTPTYVNGFQQIPWQHRTSQAERLKHLNDLQQLSPKRKTDSTELLFEETPSLVGFKSFDLGNKNVVGTGYCPQSEPVKRKIYTCSATFGKLQKTLLGKQTEVHPSNDKKKEKGKFCPHKLLFFNW